MNLLINIQGSDYFKNPGSNSRGNSEVFKILLKAAVLILTIIQNQNPHHLLLNWANILRIYCDLFDKGPSLPVLCLKETTWAKKVLVPDAHDGGRG